MLDSGWMRSLWAVAFAVACAACKADRVESAHGSAAPIGSNARAQPALAMPLRLVNCAPARLSPRVSIHVTKHVQGALDGAANVAKPALFGQGIADSTGRGLAMNPAGNVAGIGELGGASVPQVGQRPPAVTGELAALTVSDGLDRTIVQRLLRRNTARFGHCYEQALRATPTLAGAVEMRFSIDQEGKVVSAMTQGLTADVRNCIAAGIQVMAFPKPADATLVHVKTSIEFSPPAGPRGRAVLPKPAPKPVVEKPQAPKVAQPKIADTREWTPFSASAALAPDDVVGPVAAALQKAIGLQLGKLERCFAASSRPASLRAVLRVAFDGAVIGARVGGAGDHQIEACIASALIGLEVAAPPLISEVACDFERGDPQPWRVTREAGYIAIEVTKTDLRRDGKVVSDDEPIDVRNEGETTYLVIADPAALVSLLDTALVLTSESSATLVAIKSEAGAPLFVGMAADGRVYDTPEPSALPVSLDTRAMIRGCVGDDPVAAVALEAAALDGLFKDIRKKCATQSCSTTVTIALDDPTVAKDLVAITSAARRAGFERILLGGSGCPK